MSQIDESQSIVYYNSRPGIPTDGGVLIFNQRGSLLVVKPNYRNTWTWPGGGREDGESPMAAAIRECREEIGLCPAALRLAFVNYIPSQPDGRRDFISFAFTADPVEDDFIGQLTLQQDELADVRFIPAVRLGSYLKAYRVRSIQTYLENEDKGALLYLEDGLIPGV